MKFREVSFDLLADLISNLDKTNKETLNDLSKCSGCFKDKKLTEYIFLMAKKLSLDPLAGYHAIELLQRFMTVHLTKLFTTPTPQGAAEAQSMNYEDTVFNNLKDKFPLIIFSCVQLASKMSLHSEIIDNNTAVRFLHSVGHSVTKQTLLESELMVLKGLDFRLNVSNPLTYVEILLEVLGHNEPSTPVEQLYDLCHHILRFVSLEKTAIYDSLLVTSTKCLHPSVKQREKFVTVTEDRMLLAVGVVAVASYIHHVNKWEQIVGGLNLITGISRRSIIDFAHVTLMHIGVLYCLGSTKCILGNLHLDASGGFPPWGIFEVTASSAVMLWVPLEITGRQDTESLFYGLPGSDEALSPELQVAAKEVLESLRGSGHRVTGCDCCTTHMTLVVNGPDTRHIHQATSVRGSSSGFAVDPACACSTPMGVALCDLPLSLRLNVSGFDRRSSIQSVWLRLVPDRI
ncbi:cyclin N-terminal domain-containing protein 1 [Sphaeramia orbicularis]|uniref:cyclin N-terminal domain-containing protein 1 n=1 Tax=Sphaeramia orbicularis TaxID=375764 RepID=UPI00117D443E|nr:cyclin N-terminal domain-containing protein 1 [Sphaeramia orbicularis]